MKSEQLERKDLLLYYSLITGDIYYVEPSDAKNLNKSEIPLLKKPSTSCKKCFGRGFIGKDIKINAYIPCRCMQRCFDFSKTEDSVEVDTIKTVQ